MSQVSGGFARIAASRSATEIRLWVAALEGAGFTVIVPGFGPQSGPSPPVYRRSGWLVTVPKDESDEARAFLDAIADGTATALDPDPSHAPAPDGWPPEPSEPWTWRAALRWLRGLGRG